MRHRAWGGWLLSAAVGGGAVACSDCDRAGCGALTKMATPGDTGVAGVVAELRDVVTDGCGECPLGAASLQVWTLEEPFERRSEAAELAAARSPDLTREIAGAYGQALESGWYMLCVRPNCVELNIHAEETLTVNIKRRDGPTGFFVGRPSTGPLEEDFGFDVGY